MNRYTVEIALSVVRKDGSANFGRFVELPFVPVPGMVLTIHDEDADYVVVGVVEYFLEDETFLIQCEDVSGDDCSCGPGDGCCEIEPAVKHRLAHGWEQEGEIRWVKDEPYGRLPWQFTTPPPVAAPPPAPARPTPASETP